MNNISLLKGFTSYLEELNEVSGKNYNTSSDSVSIFMYANEFKNYIADELDVDASIFSKSINDILNMDIVNGKLVEKEENLNQDEFVASEEDETKETSEPENETSSNNNKSDLTDILNNLFQDSSVIEALDSNKSGDLDEDEITSFLNTIKDLDGDNTNISLNDILSGIDYIQNGQSLVTEETEENKPEEIQDTETAQGAQDSGAANGSANASGGSSGSSGGVSGGSSAAGNVNGQGTDKKSLENLTKEELNSELKSAETDLSDQQAALSDILSGSDPKIAALQEAVDDAYETYQTELEKVDVDMAEKVDDLKQEIDAKEQEIDAKEQEISDQECTVSNCENDYNNAVSAKENLEGVVASLESAAASADEDEKADITAQLEAAKAQLEQAIQDVDAAKDAWDAAEEQLTKLQEQKENLQSGEGGLDSLNEQMTVLEQEIAEKYPEIQEYLAAYRDAKKDYTDTKQNAITDAKADILESQQYINDIKTAINDKENKEVAKEYSISPSSQYDEEEGQRLVNVARDMLARYGSTTGWCAAGVSRTINMAYGIAMGGNGCDWDTNMEKLEEQGLFVEATCDYPTADDLKNLPAGAVVCWEATTGVGEGGAKYGHVTIADGKGGEISDHYQQIITNVGGRSDTYRIFLPV